ncbi:MAG: hypothetical protein QW035_01495 [Candidatus Anstonellales archaeon]
MQEHQPESLLLHKASDESLSNEERVAAGIEYVNALLSRLDYKELRQASKNPKLPKEVAELAFVLSKIVSANLTYPHIAVVELGLDPPIEKLALSLLVNMYIGKKQTGLLTNMCLTKKLPKQAKLEAANALAELYSKEGDYNSLYNLIGTSGIPRYAKKRLSKAAEQCVLNLIGLSENSNNYVLLQKIESDEFLPQRIRSIAGEKIGKAVYNRIKSYVEEGDFVMLINISMDSTIKPALRELAKGSIEECGLSFIHNKLLLITEDNYGQLKAFFILTDIPPSLKKFAIEKIAGNSEKIILLSIALLEGLEPELRESAGSLYVEQCAKSADFANLYSVATNESFPHGARKKAGMAYISLSAEWNRFSNIYLAAKSSLFLGEVRAMAVKKAAELRIELEPDEKMKSHPFLRFAIKESRLNPLSAGAQRKLAERLIEERSFATLEWLLSKGRLEGEAGYIAATALQPCISPLERKKQEDILSEPKWWFKKLLNKAKGKKEKQEI